MDGILPQKRFVRVTGDAARVAWINDVLRLFAFNIAFRAWMASLPTAPDGLGQGKLLKMGSAAGGYTLNLTWTNI